MGCNYPIHYFNFVTDYYYILLCLHREKKCKNVFLYFIYKINQISSIK